MSRAILLRVEVPEERLRNIAKDTRVPLQFLSPESVQITWGFKDPDGTRAVQSTGYVTWHRHPGEMEVIPDDFARSVAAEVVKLLEQGAKS